MKNKKLVLAMMGLMSAGLLTTATSCQLLEKYLPFLSSPTESSSPVEQEHVHTWDKGVVEKEATCTENGKITYTCTDCEETKTEAIPALGHNYGTGVETKAPTCIEMGEMTYTCGDCGEVKTEPIDLLDHVYDNGVVTTEPSCFGYGVKTFTCENCPTSYTETLDPIGHKDLDYDGNCDGCNEFVGEVPLKMDSISLVGGPWENPEGLSWWSYSLTEQCSADMDVFSITNEKVHTEGKSALKVDFNNSSKAIKEDGAYVLHLGFKNLQVGENYTLTFYVWASEDFNGNLNKMLCNQNFGAADSVTGVYYEKNYGAEELAGKGWVKVTATFYANPKITYENMAAYRIAFDVGLAGWQGELYIADIVATQTNYLTQPSVNPNETKPTNPNPVITGEHAEGEVVLPETLEEGAVWTAGPLYFGDPLFSIDTSIEYAVGSKSILINTNKGNPKESGIILPFSGLTEGKQYELTFYVQGSTDFNGCMNNIFGNPNFTHLVDGVEIKTMLDMSVAVEENKLFTAGGMQGADWTKVTVRFTANPKDGLCSIRMQLKPNEDTVGQLWFSYFVIEEYVEDPNAIKPTNPNPVITGEHAEGEIALPDELVEGGVWTAGPLWSNDPIAKIDTTIEYATGSKSIMWDYTKSTQKEAVVILPISGLTAEKQYELTFYVQGSTDFNGKFGDIFANPNFTHLVDGVEIKTMLDVSVAVEENKLFTAGGMQGADWTKVTIKFTANPKDGYCSYRMQVTPTADMVGQLWFSYFVVEEAEVEVEGFKPTNPNPIITGEHAEGEIALPDELVEGGVWTAGPLWSNDPIAKIDTTIEYATGSKSIMWDYTKSTQKEAVVILPISGLTAEKQYELTFYVQGSTDFNGKFGDIFANPNFTHLVDGVEIRTMLDVSVAVEENKLFTAGAMQGADWTKVTVKFTANPKDGNCSIRMQVTPTADMVGQLWFSYFVVEEAEAEVEEFKPTNPNPVITGEHAEGEIALPDELVEGGVWTAGPLWSNDPIAKIDTTIEYATGSKSIMWDYTKSTQKEAVVILPISGLTVEKQYELTFYVQGSTDFNGKFGDIFANPNYTHLVDGVEIRTMLDVTVTVEENKLFTAGGMQGADWTKVTVKFTANPKDGYCSYRMQVTPTADMVGQLWFSYFVVEEAEVEVEGFKPTNPNPVITGEHAEGEIALPDELVEGGVWTAGPLWSNDPIAKIDTTIEYATGSKSIMWDYTKSTQKEAVVILALGGLTAEKQYELTFYVQGSLDFNGKFGDIFANPNFTHLVDGVEIRTMLDVTVTVEENKLFTAGAMQGADWTKVTIKFTANPKDGNCSIRMQVTPTADMVGQLWFSYFVVEEAEAEVEGFKPTNPNPVITGEHAEGEIALPDELVEGGVWTAGPLWANDPIAKIDTTIEYATGSKSIMWDYTKSTQKEAVVILPISGLTAEKQYELTFYVQGSTDFNGKFGDIFANPNFTHLVDGVEIRTMLDVTVTVEENKLFTAGAMQGADWTKVTVKFTANPKDGNCSIRMQVTPTADMVGQLWFSYFVVTEVTEA